ncbi:unnamed protein product [Mytilus edulis]|uniref:EGF-like domain-containing protein n=1 Tax=Mytilus edulis TaxID=6550 RepID=A0A8S3PRK4_MYTED|nr:unnamed protein product [Mytilus edulis]
MQVDVRCEHRVIHIQCCPAGTYGKSCKGQCLPGYYGEQCNSECNCSSAQECHHIFGCVCPVGYTGNKCDQDVTSVENTVTHIVVTGYASKAITIEETTIKNSEAVVESTTTSPYAGFYHEIDENIFKDVTPSLPLESHPSKMEAMCFIPQENSLITRSTELVNTDYLDPVFAAEDDEECSQHQELHKKITCQRVSPYQT